MGILSTEAPPLEGEVNPSPQGEGGEHGGGEVGGESTGVVDAAPVERVALPKPGRPRKEPQPDVSKQIAELQDTIRKKEEETRAELARRDAELAHLRGGFEVMQQQRAAPPPVEKSPEDLHQEAIKLLDANDLQGYQKKLSEAIRAEAKRDFEKLIPRQAPQGQNPVISALLAQHPTVLAAGQRGMQLASAYDNVLAAQGLSDGPDRWKRAMEMAQNDLGGQQKPTPSFSGSQATREALSGIPTNRTTSTASGEDREPGVVLNEYDIKWMQAADMTKDEYVKYVAKFQPHRVVK